MPGAPTERETHLHTIPYKAKQNCLRWCVLDKLRNAISFSCLGAWPSQQNILLIPKVWLMPKTSLVNSSLSPRMTWSFPDGQRQLYYCVLAPLGSSSRAAPMEPGESSGQQRESTTHTIPLPLRKHLPPSFPCTGLNSWKGLLDQFKKQGNVETWIIHGRFFYK